MIAVKRYTISYNFDNCFTRIEESKRNLVNYLIRTRERQLSLDYSFVTLPSTSTKRLRTITPKKRKRKASTSEKRTIPNPLEFHVIPPSRLEEGKNRFSSNRASSRSVYIRLRIMVGKKRRRIEVERRFLEEEEPFFPKTCFPLSK